MGNALAPKPSGALFGMRLALLLLIACGGAFALASGTFTDYVYDKDYHGASAPAQVEMTCEFFNLHNSSCAILGVAPGASREQILLALIRKGSPEENQDWVRFWNSRLPVRDYYEEAGDGLRAENGSLKNAWFRVIDFYPSVFDPRDNYTYLPSQALVNAKSSLKMVVPTAMGQDVCAQDYQIAGYDFELNRTLGAYSTRGAILPVESLLAEGQKANLTISLGAISSYSFSIYRGATQRYCDEFNQCEDRPICTLNQTGTHDDTILLSREVGIKRYPDTFSYQNRMVVPKRGYAQGIASISLPSDFLSWELRVKGQSVRISRNDLQFSSRGSLMPVLSLVLQPSPARQNTLKISSLAERDEGGNYFAEVKYKLFVESPDIAPSDCTFILRTPFATRTITDACDATVVQPHLEVKYAEGAGTQAQVVATVTDPLGAPIEGAQIDFSGAATGSRVTDEKGVASITLSRRESTVTVVAKVAGSEEVADAQGIAYVPGIGSPNSVFSQPIPAWAYQAAPILILMVIASAIAAVIMRRRSQWAFPFALLMLLAFSQVAHAQGGAADLQATIDACRNYDFDNAVRHFGECAESYRIATEFDAMRSTVAVLVANIAPLVVANPDIAPYREAYSSMSKIALSLFRVAWAFNSLYLILNVFNPQKRSDAIKQYIWLIAFVIFIYASYFLIEDALTLVNVISIWVAGPDSSASLQASNVSVEFISENYEMLKLILPFLNMTYLVLLARYILVIGTILFFPFTLLLYFTTATRGLGQAALTVTFITLGLGILNSVLMLIYNILATSVDPLLSSSFSTTFFSASFLIFFGFINALALAIAFLSGIIYVGQNKLA